VAVQVKDDLREVLEDLKGKGIGRIYYGPQNRTQVALTEEDAQKYENVWLSKEEYDANQHEVAALARIWENKMARIH
jgi:hypothetical protein